MQINSKWKIGSNSYNIILYQFGSNKWSYFGYYATLHNALKALVDQEVRDTKLESLDTVIKALDRVYELIRSLPPITVNDLSNVAKTRRKE